MMVSRIFIAIGSQHLGIRTQKILIMIYRADILCKNKTYIEIRKSFELRILWQSVVRKIDDFFNFWVAMG